MWSALYWKAKGSIHISHFFPRKINRHRYFLWVGIFFPATEERVVVLETPIKNQTQMRIIITPFTEESIHCPSFPYELSYTEKKQININSVRCSLWPVNHCKISNCFSNKQWATTSIGLSVTDQRCVLELCDIIYNRRFAHKGELIQVK